MRQFLLVEFCFGASPTIKVLMMVVEEEIEVPRASWPFPDTSVAASCLPPEAAAQGAYSRGRCSWDGLSFGQLSGKKAGSLEKLPDPTALSPLRLPPKGFKGFGLTGALSALHPHFLTISVASDPLSQPLCLLMLCLSLCLK